MSQTRMTGVKILSATINNVRPAGQDRAGGGMKAKAAQERVLAGEA